MTKLLLVAEKLPAQVAAAPFNKKLLQVEPSKLVNTTYLPMDVKLHVAAKPVEEALNFPISVCEASWKSIVGH